MKNKKKIIFIISLILLIIGIIITIVAIITNKHKNESISKEKNFEIISLNNNYNKYEIVLSEVDNKTTYEIILTDEENNEIIKMSNENRTFKFDLPLEYLINNKIYLLNAKAYKDDEEIATLKELTSIKWDYASFSKSNVVNIQDETLNLVIDGEIKDNYRIVIKSDNNELYNDIIKDNNFNVPIYLYKGKNIKLDIELVVDEHTLSILSVTNTKKEEPNIPAMGTNNTITDIKITSPSKNFVLSNIVDIVIEYTGGDNSISKTISVYENNQLIKSETLSSNSYVIPSSLIKSDSGYKVVIEAINGNNKKSNSIYFSTITDGRNKMVELAKLQIDNKGDMYWAWWGYNNFAEWCAIFISWLASQNGYLDAGIIPSFQGVGSGVKWFKERDQFKSRSSGYIPQPGDIIFFDYHPENPLIDHVGIVEYSDGANVYTIEGNIGTKPNRVCGRKTYAINDAKIYGYGVPNY